MSLLHNRKVNAIYFTKCDCQISSSPHRLSIGIYLKRRALLYKRERESVRVHIVCVCVCVSVCV